MPGGAGSGWQRRDATDACQLHDATCACQFHKYLDSHLHRPPHPPPTPPMLAGVDIEDEEGAERALTLSNPVLESLEK